MPYRTQIGPSCSSPVKKRHKPSPVTDSEEFDKTALGRLIYDFHRTEKGRVALKRVHKQVGSQFGFKGGMTIV
jgi:hypothetical protein